MDMTTLLIIVVVVLLLGGGCWVAIESGVDSRMACPVTDEQLPHDRSADGFFVAAVGGRVAAGEASGAFCGRGDRRARFARDGRRVSGRWGCGAPSQNAVGGAGLRLCDGRILEPEAGAGDVRLGGVPFHRGQRSSRPRYNRGVPAAVSQRDRSIVRSGFAAGA